ncbi:Low-density receptor-like protein [Cocos nucifera]|uniref:Low-density receptor-like protein n=1 Tax=Cocos nucifera TaxID=13894 RepID=A0A8K0MV72_COCNU|nr:Low-density receptor-like protein [Cocos nucifera]
MVSSVARVSLRVAAIVAILLVAFYVGRPLYWKLSATIHEIREKRQTVREGISQFVLEAQRTVGWVRDESDSGSDVVRKASVSSSRRFIRK